MTLYPRPIYFEPSFIGRHIPHCVPSYYKFTPDIRIIARLREFLKRENDKTGKAAEKEWRLVLFWLYVPS